MTSYTVTVDSLGQAGDILSRLSSEWPNVRTDAMVGALVNGPMLRAVWTRTPKSLRQRYAVSIADTKGINGVRLGYNKGAVTLSSGWRKKFSASDLAEIDAYGKQKLARSLLPWGQTQTPSSIKQHVTETQGSASFRIGTSVSYAERMHASRETHVWTPGDTHGWSTSGTGGGYISVPVREHGKDTADDTAKNIVYALRSRGLA